MIDNLKTSGEWKSQLIMRMMRNTCRFLRATTKIDLFLQRYQESIENSMKYSKFVFDFANGLHYKCHKVSFIHVRSYIDSLKWLKKN